MVSTCKRIFTEIKRILKEEGIELDEIEYSNGYMSDTGKDSNITFKVKGLSKWLFGCWIIKDADINGYKITVFTQYERFIDKFKPFYSTLQTQFELRKRGNKYWMSDLDVNDLPDIIKWMKKHPVKAFSADSCGLKYVWEYNDSLSLFGMLKEIWTDEYHIRMKKYWYKKIQAKLRDWNNKGYIEAYYEKDHYNKEPIHYNDDYYIYTENDWADYELSKLIKKLQKKCYIEGTFYLDRDPLNFYLDLTQQYYTEGSKPERGTKEYKIALKEVYEEFITSEERQKCVERMV